MVLFCDNSFSQEGIKLGAIRVYPSIGERVEFDDNIFQVSGKGLINGRREEKQSDIINIITPGLYLDLPFEGGDFIPGKKHNINLDWHSDFKNYEDNAKQNQQNHFLVFNGSFEFPGGFEIKLQDIYSDDTGTLGSETDQLHPNTSNTGKITVNMPDYFTNFDAEISYEHYDMEYDESALRRANRFRQEFTLKVPYKIAPKIKIFSEYTYGFIEYDASNIADAMSDSHYNKIFAGIEWDITGKTKGTAKFGFKTEDYDNAEKDDTKSFIAQIGATVDLTKRTQLSINAGRETKQSEFTANSNSFDRNFANFNISRQAWKHLLVKLDGSFDLQLYHGSERKDHMYEYGLSTQYEINKWLNANFEYSLKDRRSNFELQSDRINTISIGIAAAF